MYCSQENAKRLTTTGKQRKTSGAKFRVGLLGQEKSYKFQIADEYNELHTKRALQGGGFILIPVLLEQIAASPMNMDDDISDMHSGI